MRPLSLLLTSLSGSSTTAALGALLRPFQAVMYVIAGLMPRDPDWWVFGSWSGRREGDSPRVLMEYIRAHRSDDVRTTWITANPQIRSRMKSLGVDCRMRWSPSGIWAGLRSGVYLYDGLTRDINHWLSRGALGVQLRHGIGPKRVERAIESPSHRLYRLFKGNVFERGFWSILIPWHLVVPDLAIASSQAHAEIATETFGIAPELVQITGLPRHDVFFDDSAGSFTQTDTAARSRLEEADKPSFLYLPTFRDLDISSGFDWEKMSEAAVRADLIIHVKLHMVDENRGHTTQEDVESQQNLVWVPSEVDPMALYPVATGLITDYSSVAFDMMLLERPIIYFVHDEEAYAEGRTTHFSLKDTSPGPLCYDHAELAAALRDMRDGDLGDFADDYKRIASLFHTFHDGKNSERVFDFVRARTS